MMAAPPLSGCPLATPPMQIPRWSSQGKGTTIGAAIGIIVHHRGVSPCCTNPPTPKAHHRNDTTIQGMLSNLNLTLPHPPRSAGVTIVAATTAIATHTTSQDHCAQERRNTIGIWLCVRTDIATVWTYPTPVQAHTAGRCTNNTRNQGHRAVCPSTTRMSTK